ncbi:uracil-DNA glycosylase family protein [Sphingorhabdus sp.]|uniref:uracil-DNA glycosylase family protein n=1 Tax=Sphingorhabdus sp. TaxID=1902408 RepID=UPI003592F0C8
MEQQGENTATRLAESFAEWWKLAGLEGAVDDKPVNWLASDSVKEIEESSSIVRAKTNETSIAPPLKTKMAWPNDIEILKKMVAEGAELPCNTFGVRTVAPIGPENCDVMIISDLPEVDDLDSGALNGGFTGTMLGRMLAAINIDLSSCYWTALATTRPSTGDIPEENLPQLTDFVRHQIALVNPRSIILLGSSACNALLGEELLKTRQILANINHDGNNMTAMATFHPRTLIARPAQKALAWRDLQMFAQRAGL